MPKTRRIAPSIIRNRWNGPLVKTQNKIKGGLPNKYVLVLRTFSIQGKKREGGGSAKRNSVPYFREGRLREVRMISEEKAHFCREDLPKSYFLRPSLVFLPHTKSFILLLHLLHLGQTDYWYACSHFFYLEVDGNVSCYYGDGWYREHHDVHHHLWTFALQFSMWSFVIRHCIVSIVYQIWNSCFNMCLKARY